MEVIFYKAPNGSKEVVEISNVYAEDEKFFNENGIIISMEEVGGQFVVYADTGMEDEDGEPVEFLEIAKGRKCKDVLKSLRILCEDYLNKREQE